MNPAYFHGRFPDSPSEAEELASGMLIEPFRDQYPDIYVSRRVYRQAGDLAVNYGVSNLEVLLELILTVVQHLRDVCSDQHSRVDYISPNEHRSGVCVG